MTVGDNQIATNTSENWLFRGTWNREVTFVGTSSYVPIPPFALGEALASPFLAIAVLVADSRPTWKWGGTYSAVIPVPFNPSIAPNNKIITPPIPLTINRLQLLTIAKPAAGEYDLWYTPPGWFKDVELQLWEYVGPISNFSRGLLTQIDSGVQSLLTQ